MIQPYGKPYVRYAAAAVAAGLMTLAFLGLQRSYYGPLSQRGYIAQFMVLCDAFSLPGIVLIFFGALVALVNQGALDGLSYVGHYVYCSLITGKRGNIKRYGDYLEQRRGKRKTRFGYLFVVGGIYLLVGLVFYWLYVRAL